MSATLANQHAISMPISMRARTTRLPAYRHKHTDSPDCTDGAFHEMLATALYHTLLHTLLHTLTTRSIAAHASSLSSPFLLLN